MKFVINSLLFLLLTTAVHAEPPFSVNKQDVLNINSAVIETSKGFLYVKLYPDAAPVHVANFKFLSDQGFYNNLKFHIYERNYLLQTGAPTENPASGPNYSLPAEFNDHSHIKGALSMVRKPDYLDFDHNRNSHGSQFRIILANSKHMDGQFTVFGQIVSGFDVLEQLRQDDQILNITVYVK